MFASKAGAYPKNPLWDSESLKLQCAESNMQIKFGMHLLSIFLKLGHFRYQTKKISPYQKCSLQKELVNLLQKSFIGSGPGAFTVCMSVYNWLCGL